MKTTLEKLRESENYFRRLSEDDSASYDESENYREHANGIAQAIAEMTLLRDREANTMKLAEHVEVLGLDKARLDWLKADPYNRLQKIREWLPVSFVPPAPDNIRAAFDNAMKHDPNYRP